MFFFLRLLLTIGVNDSLPIPLCLGSRWHHVSIEVEKVLPCVEDQPLCDFDDMYGYRPLVPEVMYLCPWEFCMFWNKMSKQPNVTYSGDSYLEFPDLPETQALRAHWVLYRFPRPHVPCPCGTPMPERARDKETKSKFYTLYFRLVTFSFSVIVLNLTESERKRLAHTDVALPQIKTSECQGQTDHNVPLAREKSLSAGRWMLALVLSAKRTYPFHCSLCIRIVENILYISNVGAEDVIQICSFKLIAANS